MENKYHRYLNLPFEIAKPKMFNDFPSEMKHHDINDISTQTLIVG